VAHFLISAWLTFWLTNTMNTHISIIGALTGEQFIELVKILVTGSVIVALAYGAYKNGYVLQGSKDGVDITLKPSA